MKTEVSKFSFKVPETHPQAGEKIEKPFEYQQTETDAEATAVMAEKKWKLTDLINGELKATARNNAYQSALLPFRPSEVPQEDIVERMVRDFIRLGIPEEAARAQVAGMLASTQKAVEA